MNVGATEDKRVNHAHGLAKLPLLGIVVPFLKKGKRTSLKVHRKLTHLVDVKRVSTKNDYNLTSLDGHLHRGL